jgi:hypothetical protein
VASAWFVTWRILTPRRHRYAPGNNNNFVTRFTARCLCPHLPNVSVAKNRYAWVLANSWTLGTFIRASWYSSSSFCWQPSCSHLCLIWVYWGLLASIQLLNVSKTYEWYKYAMLVRSREESTKRFSNEGIILGQTNPSWHLAWQATPTPPLSRYSSECAFDLNMIMCFFLF